MKNAFQQQNNNFQLKTIESEVFVAEILIFHTESIANADIIR